MSFRLIPSLVIKDRRLVKTFQFKDKLYLGDPINAVRIFNQKEVDEIVIIDISKEKDLDFIKSLCDEAFMPVIVGGNFNNLEDCISILNYGAEKIIFNSVFQSDVALIKRLASLYGSQSIIASIDLKKNFYGKYVTTVNRGKSWIKSISLISLIEERISAGAGEVLIVDINRDGNMDGLNFVHVDPRNFEVPILITGGFFDDADIDRAFELGYSGIVGSSYFVFKNRMRGILITYPSGHKIFTKSR